MSRRISFALVIALTAACASAAQSKRHAVRAGTPVAASGPVSLWSTLTPGPLPIGFRSWLLRHQASEFHHGAQHLVQISVWYPAAVSGGTAMTLRDYIALKATENTYDEPTEASRQAAIDDFARPLVDAGVSKQTIQSLVDSPMIARMNAPTPVNVVRAPIAFISPGNGQSAVDQAVLAEFLASRGYVVVTIPSVTRLTGPLTSDDQIPARAEEQEEDDDRAASAIGDWPNAINIPVSVIGFDIGVDAALLYAMKQPVNAIVSLDATLSPSLSSAGMYDATRQLAPILNLYENLDRSAPDFSSFYTSAVEAHAFSSMRHLHFSTYGFAAAASPEIAAKTGAGPNIRLDMAEMAQRTYEFLETFWGPRRPT